MGASGARNSDFESIVVQRMFFIARGELWSVPGWKGAAVFRFSIDLQKAFDSINTKSMLNALRRFGFPHISAWR